MIAHEGAFGTSGIHKLVDSQGNALTWFASGGDWLKEGESYTVACTVKEHGEFRGVKQTVVSRLAVWTPEKTAQHTAKAERKAAREAKKLAKIT